jgi:hypothetical protein
VTGESLYPRDLIERLRAELDRLEAVAREATEGPWTYDGGVIEAPEKAYEVRLHGGITSVDRWYVVIDSSTGNAVGDEDGRFIAANDPGVVLRTIQAHRKVLERCEIALIARDAAVDTPLAGATRMALRLEREHLELVASIYFPESDG